MDITTFAELLSHWVYLDYSFRWSASMCHYFLLPSEEYFFIFLKQTDSVLCCSREKSILTRGNLFHGEGKHLHITSGSCISFRLTHSNQCIMCRLSDINLGWKINIFVGNVPNLCALKLHVWYLHENSQIHSKSFRLLPPCHRHGLGSWGIYWWFPDDTVYSSDMSTDDESVHGSSSPLCFPILTPFNWRTLAPTHRTTGLSVRWF